MFAGTGSRALGLPAGGSQALEHGLSSGGVRAHGSTSVAGLPRSGIKAVSPALAREWILSHQGSLSFSFIFVTFISHSEKLVLLK